MTDSIPIERIENKILLIRRKKVLLDRDLAELYGVETRRLKEQVKRNLERFPNDFMLQLTENEIDSVVSQNAIPPKKFFGGALPYAFTQEGIAMLSSVLRTPQAITVNIQIMRAFIRMREMLISNEKLTKKLEELEERIDQHDENSIVIMATLRKLISKPKDPKKRKIGFH